MKGASLLLACLSPLLLLPSCRGRGEGGAKRTAESLTIAFIPEGNVFEQRARFEALFAYLSERLGMPVSGRILHRQGNIIENLERLEADAAFLGSFTYCLASRQLGMKALCRPVEMDGSSTYCGYLITRRDSGIRTYQDMAGKRFGFVDRAGTAGFLFPLAYLKTRGVEDPFSFLGQAVFIGNHEAVVDAVYKGEVDVGALTNESYERVMERHPGLRSEILVLERSPYVPDNCLATMPDLPSGLAERVGSLLTGMSESDEGRRALADFGARAFVKTTDADFANVYRLAEEAGIDLDSYRYWNR